MLITKALIKDSAVSSEIRNSAKPFDYAYHKHSRSPDEFHEEHQRSRQSMTSLFLDMRDLMNDHPLKLKGYQASKALLRQKPGRHFLGFFSYRKSIDRDIRVFCRSSEQGSRNLAQIFDSVIYTLMIFPVKRQNRPILFNKLIRKMLNRQKLAASRMPAPMRHKNDFFRKHEIKLYRRQMAKKLKHRKNIIVLPCIPRLSCYKSST